jgi:hypothetical protein
MKSTVFYEIVIQLTAFCRELLPSLVSAGLSIVRIDLKSQAEPDSNPPRGNILTKGILAVYNTLRQPLGVKSREITRVNSVRSKGLRIRSTYKPENEMSYNQVFEALQKEVKENFSPSQSSS